MIITLTTDFQDFYPAEMKGVIYSIHPEVIVVDITHNILPYNIKQGAFILHSIVEWFPEKSIHVGVIDPGVGSDRAPIIIDCDKFMLVGPDNGLLTPAAHKVNKFKVYRITRTFGRISRTFHGRDIFAPTAGYLSKGMNPEEIGVRIKKWVELDLFDVRTHGSLIQGEILHVDSFGNLITNIKAHLLKDVASLFLPEYGKTIPLVEYYQEISQGELISIIGSHDLLEISVNQGSASSLLNLHPGDKISIMIQ